MPFQIHYHPRQSWKSLHKASSYTSPKITRTTTPDIPTVKKSPKRQFESYQDCQTRDHKQKPTNITTTPNPSQLIRTRAATHCRQTRHHWTSCVCAYFCTVSKYNRDSRIQKNSNKQQIQIQSQQQWQNLQCTTIYWFSSFISKQKL